MTSSHVVLALGSNLGDRRLNLRRAVDALTRVVRVTRISPLFDTDPLDSPAGSPPFLNIVVAGICALSAEDLLGSIHEIEAELGRRRSIPNAPRTIDIDLILYGTMIRRSAALTVPHPRFDAREFVLAPLRELGLGWVDPPTGRAIERLRGSGEVRRAGSLY